MDWEIEFQILQSFLVTGFTTAMLDLKLDYLNIKKEIANKFNLSLERNNDDFGFIISPYYKRINGFIQLIPTGITTTIKGAFPVWEYDQVDAQIFGIDIDINKKINSQFDYLGNIS